MHTYLRAFYMHAATITAYAPTCADATVYTLNRLLVPTYP